MINRRDMLMGGGAMAAGAYLSTFVSPERRRSAQTAQNNGDGVLSPTGDREEYVWISANAHLPLFVAQDHPALFQAGKELGVDVTIAGPDAIDIPGLIATIEQVAARKPAGIMVVGWDATALIPAINSAINSGVPVVCVDADVPKSKRLAFIGTDWYDLGVQQGRAMLDGLRGKRGKIAMIGLLEQEIDQQAFAGFRSVVEPAGCTVLEPVQDKGNQAEAARVTSALLQAHSDLIGIAGFDSESGPGMGIAIKEAGLGGKIIATCVEREAQHLELIADGVLTAAVGQKRGLFTYLGVKSLYDFHHSPVKFCGDDKQAGIAPVAANYNTGTFLVTRDNVDHFRKKP
jgi:ribose transport system substrate-binding protein